MPLESSTDDPSETGQCWNDGVDLAWPDGKVPYGVSSAGSKYFSAAAAGQVADLAFGAWNAVSCSGGSPSVQAYNVGLLANSADAGACTTSDSCDPTVSDVITFDDDVWPGDDPTNTLALTTVTYGKVDGRIFEAYTEVNTTHPFTLDEPPPMGFTDLQTVLTHEAGHFLGLAHATQASSVMYAFYNAGRTKLTADDEAGLCAIYPPSAPSGCRFATGVPGPASASLAAAWMAAAFLRRVRRRKGERL